MTESTSRRTFLKASAATAATATIFSGAYAAAGNDILRVGLVAIGALFLLVMFNDRCQVFSGLC